MLAAADELLSNAVDMETGMRGYLLTGEEGFLKPYKDGKQVFFVNLIKLNQSVSDNSAQLVRLKETKQAIQNWIDQVSEPNILERREIQTGGKSLDDISDLVAKKTGKTFFDAFRMKIAAFKEAELALMEQRRSEALDAKKLVDVNLEILAENDAWVSHTNQVILDANNVLMAAVDMETGMRGYLLAGKDDFLKPYNNGVTNFYRRIDLLRKLVTDNPDQVQLLKKSEETIAGWQKEVTEPFIKLRRAIGNAKTMDDMADLIGQTRGKQYFDQFRNVMAAFEKEERNLKEVRQIANWNTINITYWVIGVFTVIALTLGGLSTYLISNNIANPLVITTKAIQRLANGDTSTRIADTGRRDELGFLTLAFNSMADQLIEKDKRVEAENNVRKRAEEALRDSELQKRQHLSQLEKVLRTTTVSVMTAALSHQLNQPLGAIVNFGRGSLRRLESNKSSPRNLRNTLQQICSEAERAASILRNIRDYIRGVQTEESLEDINQLVSKATKLLEPQINKQKVRLDLDLDEQSLPACVIPIEIEQAIINLAQNGIEAIEDGYVVNRKLSVRTFLDDKDFIHVSVTDTGKGVSPEMMSNLFEPFSSTKPYGMGMGLAISRIIIEKHGGDLWLEASEPVGSTIQFTLPSAKKVSADAQCRQNISVG